MRDPPEPNTAPTLSQAARANRICLVLVLAAAALFAVRIWCYFAPAYHAGVDESSYFLTARALAQTGSPAIHSPDPLQFTPANLIEVRPGVFYQKYPIGYPLLVAAGYRIAGTSGAFLVNPILGVCCLLFTALLTCELLGKWPAVVAAFCMCLNPAMLFYSNSALSHISDTCCVVLGLWLLLVWVRRGGWTLALASGLVLGFAASIRNSETLLVLAIPWALWRRLGCPRPISAFGCRAAVVAVSALALGYLAALLPNFVYQFVAFGSPLTTGYHYSGESTAFGLGGLLHHLPASLLMLNSSSFGLPALFPIAVAFLILVAVRPPGTANMRGAGTFLSIWVVPTFLLYTAYYWTSPFPELYLRLFLSIYPAIIIAAIAALELLASRWPGWRIPLRSLPIAISLGMALLAEDQILQTCTMAWVASEGADLVEANLPGKSVVIADGVSAYYLAFATDADVYSAGNFDRAWVEKHFAMTLQPPPYELNPLRAQRYFALVANQTQGGLDALLRSRVSDRLKKGQSVGLLTNSLDASPETQWARRLEPDLYLTNEVQGNAGWLFYRVAARQQPASGPAPR